MRQFVERRLSLPVLRLLGLLNQPRGQTLAEYGIIITVIAVGVVVTGMIVFRNELSGAFQRSSGCLDGTC
jgi:Flp pilus assembly pilin Flp